MATRGAVSARASGTLVGDGVVRAERSDDGPNPGAVPAAGSAPRAPCTRGWVLISSGIISSDMTEATSRGSVGPGSRAGARWVGAVPST